MNETELTRQLSVPELVGAYEQTAGNIQEAFRLLREAEAQLAETFSGKYFINFDGVHDLDPKKILIRIRKQVWRSLLLRAGIQKVMSIKRRQELENRLENVDAEITQELVYDIFAGMAVQMPDMLKESAKEVFDILRRGAHVSNHHKTNVKNARFALGEKVILVGYANDHQWYWSGRDNLNAVDRMFHLLDGKGAPDGYYSELADAVNSRSKGETEYFSFIKYKNGNLHLTFKRMDLVQRLNAIAGGEGLTEGVTS